MKIGTPHWQMKAPCPCCGQGSPTFVTWQNCGFLTVHCDEMGDTFKDPKDLEIGFTENCPNCNTRTTDFLPASSVQIIEAGFTKKDYE